MFGHKRIRELEGKLRESKLMEDHYESCYQNYKSLYETLYKKLEAQQKESNMSNGAATNNVKFCDVHSHRVFENRPGSNLDIQVDGSKRETFEAALSLAQELAARYPTNTYKVVSTVAVIKAEIPVTTTQVAKFE